MSCPANANQAVKELAMRKRILVIDDEVDMVRLLGHRLAMAEFESIPANNGKQALQILSEKELDLVITDIVMPEMDGYTLCKLMKASEHYAHLPIIVTTAFSEREQEFRDLGVDDFLIKPVDPQKLLDAIERALSRHHQKRLHKIVLFEKDVSPAIKMAIKQFRDMGFKIDVEFIQDHTDLIREVLRHQPDIFIMDTVQTDMPAPQIIRQLHGYVLTREMSILVYTSESGAEPKIKKRRRAKTQTDSIIQQCLDAGAAKAICPWDRETFLSVLFEYCR